MYVHARTHTNTQTHRTHTHNIYTQAVAAAVVTCQLVAMLERLSNLEVEAVKTIAEFEALTKRPTLYSLVYV